MTEDLSKLTRDILSEITVHMKYAKYIPEYSRRETWEELVTRNKQMHLKRYPDLKEEIDWCYQFVYDKKVLPSMRSLQFAGKPIELNPVRLYNCCYAPADDWRIFSEITFVILSGTGAGYSVQKHHVDKLPEIKKPNSKNTRRFLIGDSIEGWADAVKVLMQSYFQGRSKVKFDFSDIREKGQPLLTSGGKAPGPEPLKICLFQIENILQRKETGEKLSTLEVHDILCYIADACRSSGIRRAALIALFSVDDEEMLNCKTGNWWEQNPQRACANNSAVLVRHKLNESSFKKVLDRTEASQAGEPGIFLTNDKEIGTNPCSEISLRPNQFCNLTTVNFSDITEQSELENRVKAAAILGTLQASYTNFHYLRDVWKRTTEKEALLGISLCGTASQSLSHLDLSAAGKIAVDINKNLSKKIGINPAARITTQKPDGAGALVFGSSSGIHAWYNDYYIRRIRVSKNEPIYQYLKENNPALVEDDFFKPATEAIICVPVKAPEGSVTRKESPIDLLERVKKVYNEWIKPGHISGSNTHNVSVTVSVKPEEWEIVKDWMWKNKESYAGISLLPYFESDHTYKQPPFSECTKEEFEKLASALKEVDLSCVVEYSDNTNLQGEVACAGGACNIT